jgi:hypothetical protein
MMEIVLLLATIGQRFRFSVEQKVEVLPVLSLRPKNGIKVKLFERKTSVHRAYDSAPLLNRQCLGASL